MPDSSLKLAVFYDAENISPYAVPRIFRFLKSMGTVTAQEAHGDFSMAIMEPWNDTVLGNVPVKLVHKPHKGRKEVADKSVMNEIASYPIDHPGVAIVIVTSDNDFVETSAVLVRRGINVIGIGTRRQSRENWISSCSSFYFIEDIKSADDREIQTAKGTGGAGNNLCTSCGGVVSATREDLNCGFIRSCGQTYYFTLSDVVDGDGCLVPLKEGDPVRFDVRKAPDPAGNQRRDRNGVAANVTPDRPVSPRDIPRMRTGIVRNIKPDFGFGFIRSGAAGNGKQYYFKFSDVEGFDGKKIPAAPGEAVRFCVAKEFSPDKSGARERNGVARSVIRVGSESGKQMMSETEAEG